MCMSSAYEVREGEENVFLCDYIREAQVEAGSVKLTDITGKQMVVNGKIRTIDLVKNVILIDPA